MHRNDPTVDSGMPTFARPLSIEASRPAGPSPSIFSPLVTALTLATLSCAALFLFARPNDAQNLPAGGSHKPSAVAGGTAGPHTGASKTTTASTSDGQERGGLEFYQENVRGGMFSAPVPPKAKAPIAVIMKAPPKFVPIPVKLPTIDPFADWSYTGTVHMGDITMALLENRQTKEGQYIKAGDRFMGAQVQSISDQMVTLMNAGKPSMLAKSDTIIVTPLSQDAPGKNGPQNGQAQNGQPQNAQPQAIQLTPTDAAQPTITLPNGRVLTGDRATRYQQRLDRGFSGGGGGGNNGGGRGNNGGGGGNNGGGGRRGGTGGG
jgi:hypothetical protein